MLPSKLHPEQVPSEYKLRSASNFRQPPDPPPEIPVKQEPSPQNLVASTTPVAFVTVTIPASVTSKSQVPSIQLLAPEPIAN